MSKLIVEMEMPRNNCEMAVEFKDVGDWCPIMAEVCDYYSTKKMPDWCPICGVLPDEHGDLIDRDIAYKEIELWKSTATDTITLCFLYHIERLLMSIRPTIAAERKDDENI